MTPTLFVLIAVAGGIGAACRLLLDRAIGARTGFPVGIAVVNATGSLALGFTTGLLIAGLLPGEWAVVIGSGFLGGYTTFSTASFETVRLTMERRYGAALAASVGMLVLTVIAAALGLALGSLFSGR